MHRTRDQSRRNAESGKKRERPAPAQKPNQENVGNFYRLAAAAFPSQTVTNQYVKKDEEKILKTIVFFFFTYLLEYYVLAARWADTAFRRDDRNEHAIGKYNLILY